MSETVRELYERERERLKALWARTNPELILKDGSLLNDAEAEVAASVVDSLWDAIVIGTHEECDVCRGKNPLFMSCGCGRGKSYVVDAETVEACATIIKAGFNIAHAHAGEIDGDEFCQTLALEILEAAHIEVPDEVVGPLSEWAVEATVDSGNPAFGVAPGDKRYIKRAVTADCHSKEE